MSDVLTGTTGAIRCRGRTGVPPQFRPPRAPGHFVGMGDELARIRTGGVTVLSGPGGVGKTALALKWLQDRGSGDQLYVDLAAREPVADLLRSFGLIEVPAEDRAAVFRSLAVRRQFTLLLDNADSAEQVTPLLPASGTVVVTTRKKLNLEQALELLRQRSPERG